MASNPTAAPSLFDRALLSARQNRARHAGPATFLLDRVAEDMAQRLHAVLREFSDVADIWSPGEALSKPVRDRFKSIVHIDLQDSNREALALQPESLDLVVSALAFQFVNDLPGVLAQIRRALPVTDVDRIVVRYDSAFALMQDLRRMGATNILVERRRTATRRATMLRMAQIYAERFADADGRIRATFDVIWLSAWAPHQSQQKPLKPGSAKVGLAEAVQGRKR